MLKRENKMLKKPIDFQSRQLNKNGLKEIKIDSKNHSSGKKVIHKVFGEGVIKSIVEDKIIVSFGTSEKMFIYPDAFKSGYLIEK